MIKYPRVSIYSLCTRAWMMLQERLRACRSTSAVHVQLVLLPMRPEVTPGEVVRCAANSSSAHSVLLPERSRRRGPLPPPEVVTVAPVTSGRRRVVAVELSSTLARRCSYKCGCIGGMRRGKVSP